MDDNKKLMTIFYRKKDLSIHAICDGKQNISYFGLDPDDANMIYGFFYVESNMFILRNKKGFEIVKNDDGNLSLKMKNEYKELLKSYL